MFHKTMSIAIALWFIGSAWAASAITAESPSNAARVDFALTGGRPVINVSFNGEKIVTTTAAGLKLKETGFSGRYRMLSRELSQFAEDYEMIWWKNRHVRNEYRQLVIHLADESDETKRLDLIVRVYDDGFALRYQIPQFGESKSINIEKDLTQFEFSDNFTWWSANGERYNLGPEKLERFPEKVPPPVLLQCSEKIWAALLEADISEMANFEIGRGESVHTLVPVVTGPSVMDLPAKTSWRVLMLGERAGDLVESNLLVNLNPPTQLEDVSWIKPGTTMWDWRVWGYKAADGFEYGLNTVSHKRFIDFAAENNVDYLLMDADWYGPEFDENSNPATSRGEINIEENMAYAKSRGVGIILYLNDVGAKKYGLENVLRTFSDWGAAGIKYGFMKNRGQDKVLYTRRVIELCAKYRLLVDFHDNPIPPNGESRTWPNVITREYCHSQADAHRSYFPETAVSAPFINMLTGALDMCNGWFGFNNAESRVKVFEKIPGTVAAETAKLAVVFSGLQVLSDAPEEYRKKADLFDFIKNLPDSFDQYRVFGGDPDSYIIVGRRKGENWYIGCLTNRDAREVELPLTFLHRGVKYDVTQFSDAPDSHYENNREAYRIEKSVKSSLDTLRIKMAPGGGQAIRIEPRGEN